MNRLYLIVFSLLILGQILAQNQDPIQLHLDVNINEPGAEYAFSFIHLTDVHIGEGDEDGDYGTIGINDTMPIGDIGAPAIRLRKVVNWINANHLEKNIKFVVVSGDLTDSGEISEFLKFKEIMDVLTIPYIPLIGNHDVWPYTKAERAPFPSGDSLINNIFESTFEDVKAIMDDWDDGTRLTRILNPQSNNYNFLQNFSFRYQNFHFLLTDFNPRYPAANNEPGIGPEAEIMNFEDGTWQWVKQKVASLTPLNTHNVFMVSHHPPLNDFWSLLYAFDIDERKTITDFLWNYKPHMAAWLAGHIHRSLIYQVNTVGLQPYQVIKCAETAANKEYEKGLFRIVNVYDTPVITSIENHTNQGILDVYPNPSNGRFQMFVKDNTQKYLVAEVFNSAGQLVFNQTLEKDFDSRTFSIDIGEQPKGLYKLRIMVDDKYFMKNVIVVK